MCRNATFVPVQELIRAHQGDIKTIDFSKLKKRALKFTDFFPKDAKSTGAVYGSDGSLTGKLDLDLD